MEVTLHIENMVCNRCIKVLKQEFEQHQLALKNIELGKITLDINEDTDLEKAKDIVDRNGFSIINTQKQKIIENVKISLIKLLDKIPLKLDKKLSAYLEEAIHLEYSKISKTFSTVETITIEKYFIRLKIEKSKELIQSDKYNFTEISQLLDYNNINHFSRQFKNETGMSLTDYKKDQRNTRKSLDQII